MLAYLRRLVTTGAAYQAAEIVAKGIAVFTLPLYTRHVSTAGYGTYNSLLTAVILFSIVLRLGVGEAFVRFYFTDSDLQRRTRIARTAMATVAWTTTVTSLVAVVFAGELSRLILGYTDATLMDCAILGLWAFTNIEMAYAQLRVDERARVYMYASGANVAMTVAFTVALVVFADEGARGLLLGNFGASAIVVLGLWWFCVRGSPCAFTSPTCARCSDSDSRPCRRTRAYMRCRSPIGSICFAASAPRRRASTRSRCSSPEVVFILVRGFQYAWPPLAYSIDSDADASRLYSLVTTYFVLATGVVVVAVALLGRWLVRLLAAPEYYGAYRALPWLALGWTLYGLYLLMIVITGRARVTRRNLPAAAAGLAVNVALLFLLIPSGGLSLGLGLAGAGIALCGAYAVMVAIMHLLTRGVFAVEFQWRRLAQLTAILTIVAVSGDLLLPTSGLAGLALRIAWLAFVPALLLITRFVAPHERAQVRALMADGRRRIAAFRAGHGDVEAYAEDPLKDI